MRFRDYIRVDELFYAMAAAIGGSNAKKVSQVAKSNPKINALIWKVHEHPLYDPKNEKPAVLAVIKDEKLDRKTAKYLKKLFRV